MSNGQPPISACCEPDVYAESRIGLSTSLLLQGQDPNVSDMTTYPQSIYEVELFVLPNESAKQAHESTNLSHQIPQTNQQQTVSTQAEPGDSLEVTTLELVTGLPDPLIGKTIGRYEIVDTIGRGNMAIVYKARHLDSGDMVAIKTYRNDSVASQKERFDSEIWTHSRLCHKNIVQFIHALYADGRSYLVIENVKGLSLQSVLEMYGPVQNPINIFSIFSQICDALSYAHGRGIIHRDLKPGNVILSPSEGEEIQVKLADFGIARDETEQARLTQDGSSIGSPLYMSPEQCQGEDLLPCSDVYSLGILMTETVSGVCPYRGKSIISIIRSHCNPMTRPEPLHVLCPDLPCVHTLDAILSKALETEVEKRYQSIGDLRNALEEWFLDTLRKPADEPSPGSERAITQATVEAAEFLEANIQNQGAENVCEGVQRQGTGQTPSPMHSGGSVCAKRSWLILSVVLAFFVTNALTAYVAVNWGSISNQMSRR